MRFATPIPDLDPVTITILPNRGCTTEQISRSPTEPLRGGHAGRRERYRRSLEDDDPGSPIRRDGNAVLRSSARDPRRVAEDADPAIARPGA